MLLIIFIIDFYVFVKMIQLEKSNKKCPCAKNSYVTKILISIILIFVLIPLMITFNIFFQGKRKLFDNKRGNDPFVAVLHIELIALFILYAYSSAMMFNMAKKIEKDNCSCANSSLKNLLKYYSMIRLTPIIIIFVRYIILLLFDE